MEKAAPPLTWSYCGLDELVSVPVVSLHRYWMSKVRDGRMPSRRDIDPIEFREFLPNCLILDVEGPGLFRYRVFGSHVADWNERDLTGLLLDHAALGDAAPMFLDAYERVCREKTPSAFRGSLFWQDRQYQRFEQVTLPLSRDGIDVDKILCAVAFGELGTDLMTGGPA